MKGVLKKDSFQLTLILNKESGLNYKSLLNTETRHERSKITINEKGKNIIVEITASDATALRASANSILRNLQVIESTNIKQK